MKKIILTSKIKIVSKSEASLSNPFINRVDFILTDDQPNANGVGIRRDDFLDFAQSSLFMPIKMTVGDIKDHSDSTPVGVITQAEIDSSKIFGSGVLWPEERPADVALIKDRTEKGEAQLSWEVGYLDESVDDEGIIWLNNPKLLAATLVRFPAYQGRTPIVGFSSEETMTEEENLETEQTLDEFVEEEIVEEIVEEETFEEVLEEETQEEDPTSEQELELQKLKEEVETLRAYQMKIERSKVVRETLGESLNDEDVHALIGLNDDQLKVVKKLMSSKKTTSSKIPGTIPGIEAVKPKDILKNYFGGSNANQQIFRYLWWRYS